MLSGPGAPEYLLKMQVLKLDLLNQKLGGAWQSVMNVTSTPEASDVC